MVENKPLTLTDLLRVRSTWNLGASEHVTHTYGTPVRALKSLIPEGWSLLVDCSFSFSRPAP